MTPANRHDWTRKQENSCRFVIPLAVHGWLGSTWLDPIVKSISIPASWSSFVKFLFLPSIWFFSCQPQSVLSILLTCFKKGKNDLSGRLPHGSSIWSVYLCWDGQKSGSKEIFGRYPQIDRIQITGFKVSGQVAEQPSTCSQAIEKKSLKVEL